MEPLYDSISIGYADQRRADPRIATRIHAALGDAGRVLNVGAGTGNYEPRDRQVVAVEPSSAMIAQRGRDASAVVRGVAEALPFGDGSFDAAMGVLTLHHWTDLAAGLAEMARVAARQVLFTYEPELSRRFWMVDYFRGATQVPSEVRGRSVRDVARHLQVERVEEVLVPWDCTDGFGAAYWRRPEAYLDPAVQQAQSWLALLSPDELAAGAQELADDLESGAWDERHGHLRQLDELDAGYRLIVANGATSAPRSG